MITDIRFACGRCGQDMVADSTAAGLSVHCPHCECLVMVPAHPLDEMRLDGTVDRGASEGVGEIDAEIIQLRDELAAACAECERATAANTLAQAELKTFQAERLTLKNELAQARQRLTAAESQLSQQQELLTAAQLASQQLGTEQDVLQLTLTAAKARLDATQSQLSVREAELENLQARLADHNERYSAAQHEITLLQEESTLLREHLGGAENARAEVERLQAQLKDAETGWRRAMEDLELARRASQTLQTRCDELAAESALLRADLSETQTGHELLRLRTNLQEFKEEHERVLIENRQLADDAGRASGRHGALQKALDATRHQLGEAEKRAEAVSDERLNRDNVALRGIIARQNTELEQRRLQLLRLKRMRLFVHLVYALLGLGFVILGIVLAALLPSLGL